jgi:hypothetical protein
MTSVDYPFPVLAPVVLNHAGLTMKAMMGDGDANIKLGADREWVGYAVQTPNLLLIAIPSVTFTSAVARKVFDIIPGKSVPTVASVDRATWAQRLAPTVVRLLSLLGSSVTLSTSGFVGQALNTDATQGHLLFVPAVTIETMMARGEYRQSGEGAGPRADGPAAVTLPLPDLDLVPTPKA